MEVAVIDWKSIVSKFVEDDLYEHIKAPQWFDFSTPEESVDDEAWFCRPDCNHPKTVEDFYKVTPPSKKLQKSANVSEIRPFSDRSHREGTLKKRELTQPSSSSNKDQKYDRLVEDSENQNPNISAPPNRKAKFGKAAVKSSAEKKEIGNTLQKEEMPKLKSTLSGRNLLAGWDILNQITEFCSELKKLATRANERENIERSNGNKNSMAAKSREEKEYLDDNSGDIDEAKKERMPLLEVSKEKCDTMERSILKEKQRRNKTDEAENIPVSVDLKNIKRKEEESLLQIRTCPPSPQCFSANRGLGRANTPTAFRSKPPERKILHEMKQNNKEVRIEETEDKENLGSSVSTIAEKEARSIDVFWFLKPCTLSR